MQHPVHYAAERLALRILFVALAALLVAFVLPEVWHALSPFIIAIPVAAALQPLLDFFVKRLHLKRGFAVAFWVVLVSIAAFLLLYWFVAFLVAQVVSAASNASAIVDSISGVIKTATERILGAADTMPASVSDSIRDSLNSALRWFGDHTTSLAAGMLNYVVGVASGVPYALIYANFLILGLFFITGRYPEFREKLQKRRNQDDSASINVLRRSAGKGALGYIRVQLLWFVALFAMSTVYYQVLGFQYAVLIGLLAALLELIPQFGCGVLYLPWAIICFIIGEAHNGWIVLCFYLFYSLLRRFLDPKLLGDNLGMSPLLSLVGMFVGMQLGGVIGLILGPIAMVVLVSAVRAHLFDGTVNDIRTLTAYMKLRWQRGHDKEIMNAEK